jgi:hypothetical protein
MYCTLDLLVNDIMPVVLFSPSFLFSATDVTLTMMHRKPKTNICPTTYKIIKAVISGHTAVDLGSPNVATENEKELRSET